MMARAGLKKQLNRLILLASLLSIPAGPSLAASQGPIVWIESCGLSKQTQDYLLRDMLLMAQGYRVLFGYRFTAEFHMGIRFFCTPASFHQFLVQNLPEAADAEIIGLFIPEIHLMLIDARSTNDPAATLLHETSHAFLDSTHGEYQIWLHEGLAESFEALDRQSPVLRLQVNAYARQGLEIMLRQKPDMLNLKQYLSLNLEKWRKLDRNFPVGDTAVNYSRSMAWGLARFLLESPAGQNALRQIILNGRQPRPLSDAEVLAKTWPGGFDKLQSDWLNWLKQPANSLTYPGIKL